MVITSAHVGEIVVTIYWHNVELLWSWIDFTKIFLV